jgi:hypothetical protein
MTHDDDNAEPAEKPDEKAEAESGAFPSSGNGLSSGLQPGGTLPGGGPGAGVGSIGTGAGSTGGAGTGNVASGGR